MHLILRWLVGTGALYVTAWLLQAFDLAETKTSSLGAWLIAGVVMGLVNAVVRPVVQLLALPLTCATFGLAQILVNGLLFWLISVLAEAAGAPVYSVGFLGAIVGAILLGVINGAATALLAPDRDARDRPGR